MITPTGAELIVASYFVVTAKVVYSNPDTTGS